MKEDPNDRFTTQIEENYTVHDAAGKCHVEPSLAASVRGHAKDKSGLG